MSPQLKKEIKVSTAKSFVPQYLQAGGDLREKSQGISIGVEEAYTVRDQSLPQYLCPSC